MLTEALEKRAVEVGGMFDKYMEDKFHGIVDKSSFHFFTFVLTHHHDKKLSLEERIKIRRRWLMKFERECVRHNVRASWENAIKWSLQVNIIK